MCRVQVGRWEIQRRTKLTRKSYSIMKKMMTRRLIPLMEKLTANRLRSELFTLIYFGNSVFYVFAWLSFWIGQVGKKSDLNPFKVGENRFFFLKSVRTG